jgi:hypothetical protein
LLHDLCHVPFGHSIEDDLKVLRAHDENEERFAHLWGEVQDTLPAKVRRYLERKRLSDSDLDAALASLAGLFTLPQGEQIEYDDALLANLAAQLRPLILSKDGYTKELGRRDLVRYPFVLDLVGDTICADLLDYLLRDHLNTGLPASLGKRFTSAFFVVPEGCGPLSRRAALNIMRSGHERTDVVSELLKALRYRYELSERVLCHHAKLSADAMIGKALDLWSDAVRLEVADGHIAQLDDAEDLVEAGNVRALLDEAGEGPDSGRSGDVRNRLEPEFLDHGDSGLLERMTRLAEDPPASDLLAPLVGELRANAAQMAEAVLRRELFAVAGRVGIESAAATTLWRQFGKAERRIALQDESQRFAELGREPQVLLWLPDPKMRLKLAKVLVDDGTHVNSFDQYENARGGRGGDIYSAHNHLWGLWVFTRRDMDPDKRDAALIYLTERLGVAWEGKRERYGDNSWTWLPRFALARLLGVDKPTDAKIDDALKKVAQVSNRGPQTTLADYVDRLRVALEAAG